MAGQVLVLAIFRNTGLFLTILLVLNSYNDLLNTRKVILERMETSGTKEDYLNLTLSYRWSTHVLSTWNGKLRRKFLGSKLSYYPNSNSSFQLSRIARSGDISLNPGPTTQTTQTQRAKKCQQCERTIARNHRFVQCNTCVSLFHMKCAGILPKDYKQVMSWTCSRCLLAVLPSLDISVNSVGSQLDQYDISTQTLEEDPLTPLEVLKSKYRHHGLLLHININSLQNKIDELRLINDKIGAALIMLTETKIDCTYPDSQFELQDYKIYRQDRAKGGGGILAYVSSRLSSNKIRVSKKYKLIEVLALKLFFNNINVVVLGMYRPQKTSKFTGTNYFKELEEELNHVISWAASNGQMMVILGDLNLDRLKPRDREGKLLIDMEETFDLSCLITQPTRVTPKSKTLIDVLLTNKPELFITSGTVELGLSDHHMIFGFLNGLVNRHPSKVIEFRSTKNLDEEAFKKDMEKNTWLLDNPNTPVDDQYTHWLTVFNKILDEHMPVRKMRVRKHDAPYMTSEWKAAIRKKRKYAKKFKKDNSTENWELMKKWRNNATRLRRQAIKRYWNDRCDEIKKNARKFYKTFMPFINSKSKKEKSEISLNINNKIEQNPCLIAEEFTKYFVSIADHIGGSKAHTLTEEKCYDHPSVQLIRKEFKRKRNSDFDFEPLTVEEVQRALTEINTTKAAGHDNIPPKVLKLLANQLATSLAELFNLAIKQKTWPIEWKKGVWVPIYKKEDPHDIVNYRPVTILSAVGKTFEKLLTTQLNGTVNNILNSFQSAYRRNYSCETTLIRLLEDWKHSADDGQMVGVLSTDMSKAFDSLHPSLLLSKLKEYGLSDDGVTLIKSYFTGRQNKTRLGNATSTWVNTHRGCPQGSSLGPMLWNIYQNDIFYLETNSQLSAFADDHQLYYSSLNPEQVMNTINSDGELISRWYNENFLECSLSKFQAMTIHNKSNIPFKIEICNNNIYSKEKLKLLGVIIDDHLNFSDHISHICTKVSKLIGVLMRLRNLIPTTAKLCLYKSAILPHLTYCSLVWHFCKASDRRKLERVNERGLRAVYCNWSTSYNDLLARAKLTTLYNRRLQDITLFMYKVKNNMLPDNIISLFDRPSTKYNLRNADFSIPRFSTVHYGKHSLRYLGPYLWSKLPTKIREKPSLGAFKRSIRKMDIESLVENNCSGCILCNL